MANAEAVFSARGFRRGATLGIPFGATSCVNGMLFGVVAAEMQLAVSEAVIMSSLVLSGSAQFAVMEVWSRPVAVGTAVTVTLLVNLRYVLIGSTLPASYASLPRSHRYVGAFFLSDESWAISMREFQDGSVDGAVLVGSGVTVYSGWIAGTAVGFLFAPEALRSLPGLGFMVPALLIAVLCGFWRNASVTLFPWAVAAVTALVAAYLLPGTWYILAGGSAGALLGAWLDAS